MRLTLLAAAVSVSLAAGACTGKIVGSGGDDGVADVDAAVCGDGIVGGAEQCDDGNADDTDGCIDCQFATCGDGHVRKNVEDCDDGSATCVRCEVCPGLVDPATGHCYTMIDATAARAAAEATCAATGAHLIVLDTPGEWTTVAPLWTDPFADTWLGLTRAADGQNLWAWETGAPLDTAMATWNAGEPNDSGGIEDCVEAGGAAGGWNDLACDQPRRALCERPTWTFDPMTNHAYRIFYALRTQPEAIADCASIGAHLATVTSQEEQDFMAASFAARDTWIGLFQGPSEATWFWSTGERYDFKAWGMNQPDDFMHNEDCAHLMAGTGLWNDRDCTARLPYVCEIN
ncbi:MAG TPA: lectin-like protein [Kofleriaceae bacterium]|nr:lectin-like protein [Kofleriaceae bacterium]